MSHTSRARAALAALVLVAAAVVGGCGGTTAQPAPSATAPPSIPAGITGTVHRVTRDADTGMPTLLVVDDGALKGSLERVAVSVTEQTVVWMLKGGTGTAADLGAGQMVSVWFSGPVTKSDPARAEATDVRILLEN
jgi:hypothetical protein